MGDHVRNKNNSAYLTGNGINNAGIMIIYLAPPPCVHGTVEVKKTSDGIKVTCMNCNREGLGGLYEKCDLCDVVSIRPHNVFINHYSHCLEVHTEKANLQAAAADKTKK